MIRESALTSTEGSSDGSLTVADRGYAKFLELRKAEVLCLRFKHEGFCDELYVHRKTPRVRLLHRLRQPF
jgi:hypothetical protein